MRPALSVLREPVSTPALRRGLAGASVFLGALLALGCGGGLMEEPLAPSRPEGAVKPAAPVAEAPVSSLARDAVNKTIEQGLGYFLQRVSVEPELIGGRFQGFRIVELRPAEYWRGVDLKPGDVVTQVNGQSIERDIDAYNAFQSLKAAKALEVTFRRDGAPKRLSLSIVEPAAKPRNEKPAPAPAPVKADKTNAG